MNSAGGEGDPASPRLLLDQNLAPSLARRLGDLYPGSAHVREFGLAAADDEIVWTHARAHGFTIVTKDDDFRQRSVLRGAPPHVIWLRLGNCRTAEVEAVLRARHAHPGPGSGAAHSCASPCLKLRADALWLLIKRDGALLEHHQGATLRMHDGPLRKPRTSLPSSWRRQGIA